MGRAWRAAAARKAAAVSGASRQKIGIMPLQQPIERVSNCCKSESGCGDTLLLETTSKCVPAAHSYLITRYAATVLQHY